MVRTTDLLDLHLRKRTGRSTAFLGPVVAVPDSAVWENSLKVYEYYASERYILEVNNQVIVPVPVDLQLSSAIYASN